MRNLLKFFGLTDAPKPSPVARRAGRLDPELNDEQHNYSQHNNKDAALIKSVEFCYAECCSVLNVHIAMLPVVMLSALDAFGGNVITLFTSVI